MEGGIRSIDRRKRARAMRRVQPVFGRPNTRIRLLAGIAMISISAKPEFAVSAGDGMLYVNLEDKAAVAEVDARAMRVVRQWSIAPCASPTGLAIDRQHRRLFSGCRNKLMAISDAQAGRLLGTVPVGAGVDANAYDPGTGQGIVGKNYAYQMCAITSAFFAEAAVSAAITSSWSNGQTEGQITKLEMIKRQLYGRANIDLLRARLCPA